MYIKTISIAEYKYDNKYETNVKWWTVDHTYKYVYIYIYNIFIFIDICIVKCLVIQMQIKNLCYLYANICNSKYFYFNLVLYLSLSFSL